MIRPMKRPSFKPALESKPALPKTLEEADETIRLLHETITTLTKRARQLEATQAAGSQSAYPRRSGTRNNFQKSAKKT